MMIQQRERIRRHSVPEHRPADQEAQPVPVSCSGGVGTAFEWRGAGKAMHGTMQNANTEIKCNRDRTRCTAIQAAADRVRRSTAQRLKIGIAAHMTLMAAP